MSENLPWHSLVHLLYENNLLTLEAAQHAIHAAKKQGKTIINYLVKSKLISSEKILHCCSKCFNLPTTSLQNPQAHWLQDPLITPELISRYRVIPLKRNQHFLQLALSDPSDYTLIHTLGFQTGLTIQPILVLEDELDQFILLHCQQYVFHSSLESAVSISKQTAEPYMLAEENEQIDEPVVNFVNHLLQEAIDKQLSDIHIEPYENNCRIRFRRDGLLYIATSIPLHLSTRIITRLKIMAHLNIAERRLPQDGRILFKNKTTLSMRLNTCPTVFGEKIVLRILNNHCHFAITDLGLTNDQLSTLQPILSQPQGLILVTGPTGSGKSITLYTVLQYLNQIEKNIITIEDPVEMMIDGINQVNINPHLHFNFANAIRTFLRQDPDIMMVGEIRDHETAHAAMQAAQTEHLVLSTLHANQSLQAIFRLQTMGVATHHIIDSLIAIVAQRLVRKLCPTCKISDYNHTLHYLANPNGCMNYYQGYQGRIGIFEVLPITDNIRNIILTNSTVAEIKTINQSNYLSLKAAGLLKINQGMTSQAEIARVLGSCHE